VVERQVSGDGEVLQVQETLARIPPPPLIVKVAFAASATGAAAAVMAFAVLALAAASPLLDCRALVLVLCSVLGMFALFVAGTSFANHAALGSDWGRWASLVTTPMSFWGSVNMLGIATRLVALYARLVQRVRNVYYWLLPSTISDKVTRSAVVMQKMAPRLMNTLLVGTLERPMSTEEWAAQLQDFFVGHFNLQEYGALEADVVPPELPQLPPVTGLCALVAFLWAYMKGLLEALNTLRQAHQGRDGDARLTAKELIAFFCAYFRSLTVACFRNAQLQLCVAASSRRFSKQDASDSLRWRLVADQFAWCQAQKLTVTDVAASVLAEQPAMSRPLCMWLAADTALAWCRIVPAMWEAPRARAEALRERRNVLLHLTRRP